MSLLAGTTPRGPTMDPGGNFCAFFFTISRCSEEKIFGGLRETYGKKWAVGDIIGVFLDTNDKTIGE